MGDYDRWLGEIGKVGIICKAKEQDEALYLFLTTLNKFLVHR